ncbi:hypothetical protein Slin14017_G034420 [Septoria linicola]|nr:hypothetical protein Slin14017_G034420 [Septoria linicola]
MGLRPRLRIPNPSSTQMVYGAIPGYNNLPIYLIISPAKEMERFPSRNPTGTLMLDPDILLRTRDSTQMIYGAIPEYTNLPFYFFRVSTEEMERLLSQNITGTLIPNPHMRLRVWDTTWAVQCLVSTYTNLRFYFSTASLAQMERVLSKNTSGTLMWEPHIGLRVWDTTWAALCQVSAYKSIPFDFSRLISGITDRRRRQICRQGAATVSAATQHDPSTNLDVPQ